MLYCAVFQVSRGVAEVQRAVMGQFEQGWQNNDISEKIKQQKENDMAVLQSRWKAGVATVPATETQVGTRSKSRGFVTGPGMTGVCLIAKLQILYSHN